MECCKHKHTPRSEETVKLLKNRIHRIMGQLNGIENMIEDNRYCIDVLTQISAVESALQSLGYLVLEEHLQSCVVEEIQNGNTEVVGEAMNMIKKLL